jgi:two-component system KDP operon response regulator KdpE
MSRILLVEDEDLNRTLVKAVLARAQIQAVRDAEVLDAGSLAAARERLHDGSVDLVLLDMNLPDGNGLTLARELAAQGSVADRQRPAVVAVTASVLPQDRAAAIAAGCDGFLDKPYAAADLVAVVATHLQ